MNCAASIPLSDGHPDETSFYAAEGTFGHDIAKQCLEHMDDPISYQGRKAVVEGHAVECTPDIVAALRVYMQSIREDMQNGDHSWVEMPLHKAGSQIDKDTGGTADYVRYRPSTGSLRVWDLKLGSGKYVEVEDNKQAMLYAVFTMIEVGKPITDVEVTIVQPRFEGAEPVRSWKFPLAQIMDFIADVKEAAERTRQPDPQIAAGNWCSFCKAARTCPELTKHRHSIVAVEFGAVVDTAKIAQALASVPLVKAQIKAIEEHAYKLACSGVEIPGFKLVDKLAHRRWKNEADVIEWAQEKGMDVYAPRELLSPAQVEAQLKEVAGKGKKGKAGEALEPFVERISSGTALVTVDDKRPPAKRVADAGDFAVEGTKAGAVNLF